MANDNEGTPEEIEGLNDIVSEEELDEAAELEALKAELAQAKLELAQTKASVQTHKVGELTIRQSVNNKNVVCVYGLGQWPVSLHTEQWVKLFGQKDAILAYIADGEKKGLFGTPEEKAASKAKTQAASKAKKAAAAAAAKK